MATLSDGQARAKPRLQSCDTNGAAADLKTPYLREVACGHTGVWLML